MKFEQPQNCYASLEVETSLGMIMYMVSYSNA